MLNTIKLFGTNYEFNEFDTFFICCLLVLFLFVAIIRLIFVYCNLKKNFNICRNGIRVRYRRYIEK